MSLGPHLADFLALNQEIHSVPTADALSALPDSPTDDPTTRLVLLYIVHGDHMVLELDADDEYWLPHTWYHKDVNIDSSSEAFKALEKSHMLQPSQNPIFLGTTLSDSVKTYHYAYNGCSKVSQKKFKHGAHWVPIGNFLNCLAGGSIGLKTRNTLKLQYNSLGKPGVNFLSKVAAASMYPDLTTLTAASSMRSPKRPKTDTPLIARQAKRRVAFLVLWHQGESKYSP